MGYEKFVLDADQLGMWHSFCQGVDLSENGQALAADFPNFTSVTPVIQFNTAVP